MMRNFLVKDLRENFEKIETKRLNFCQFLEGLKGKRKFGELEEMEGKYLIFWSDQLKQNPSEKTEHEIFFSVTFFECVHNL